MKCTPLVQKLAPNTQHKKCTLIGIITLLVCTLGTHSAFAERDLTNLRIGIGAISAQLSNSDNVLQDLEDPGILIAAEYPQNRYSGSRFAIYQGGGNGSDYWGFETQLMLGYGLDGMGFRIHTGPSWHRDLVTLNTRDETTKQRITGWGWQLGIGYQWPHVTLELASTIRETGDYFSLNQQIGQTKRPTVVFSNLLVSYRF